METKNKEALKHDNIVSYDIRNDAKTHKAPNPIDIPKSRINRQAETTKAGCIVVSTCFFGNTNLERIIFMTVFVHV